MDLTPTKKAVQAELKKRGLYDGEIDGIDGQQTWAAIANALLPEGVATGITPSPAPPEDKVDPRSEENILTLSEPVRLLARKLISTLKERGQIFKVTSGYRSFEQQSELYDKFKRGGPQAAPPGYSNHNFALAFDITKFDADGRPVWDSPDYALAGRIGKEIGLIWGGDWHNSDEPHFEYRPEWARGMTENQALAEYRERLKKGTALV